MQITLPVPYRIEARINRSRTGRTEQFLACTQRTFEVRCEPRVDVHLIAEWQQQWHEPNRDNWKPGTSDSWLRDFQADTNLSRLIMIDGTFYSPLKAKIGNGKWQPYTPEAFSWGGVMELRSILDMEFGGFYQGDYSKLMTEGHFWPEPGKISHSSPDLSGRTEVSNDLDKMTHYVQKKLDSFVLVDNVVFRKVPEPVIGVFATKDYLKMKITERRDSSNSYTTSYFSLNDFQAAVEHYEACRSHGHKHITSMEVSDLHVYMPAAFTMKVENAELLKTATQLLECTDKLVSKMPSDIAPLWFAVRDAHEDATAQGTEVELTVLSETIHALHDGVLNHSKTGDQLKEACSIASPAAQRWDMRPISSNRSITL